MKMAKKTIIIVAVCLGIMAAVFAGIGYAHGEDQYFTLDVNPSIEFTTNHLGKIASIHPLNSEAKKLLASYSGENKEIAEAVQEVLDLLAANGYISDSNRNDILISVEQSKESQQLLDKVQESITEYFSQNKAKATVVSQKIEANGELMEEADENHISTGKMALIEKILAGDSTITAGELAALRVSDLLDYAKEKGINIEDLVEQIDKSEDRYESDALDMIEEELDDQYDDERDDQYDDDRDDKYDDDRDDKYDDDGDDQYDDDRDDQYDDDRDDQYDDDRDDQYDDDRDDQYDDDRDDQHDDDRDDDDRDDQYDDDRDDQYDDDRDDRDGDDHEDDWD